MPVWIAVHRPTSGLKTTGLTGRIRMTTDRDAIDITKHMMGSGHQKKDKSSQKRSVAGKSQLKRAAKSRKRRKA